MKTFHIHNMESAPAMILHLAESHDIFYIGFDVMDGSIVNELLGSLLEPNQWEIIGYKGEFYYVCIIL